MPFATNGGTRSIRQVQTLLEKKSPMFSPLRIILNLINFDIILQLYLIYLITVVLKYYQQHVIE